MSYKPNIKGKLEKLKLKETVKKEEEQKKMSVDKKFKEWLKNNPDKTHWDFLLNGN